MASSAEDSTAYDTDVIVVGAGPGGTTLAYLLARSGVDVRLLERQRNLERTFRGYLFQPLVQRIFDQMGVLDRVLELDHQTVHTPSVIVYGREIEIFDMSTLDDQHGSAILMEQPPLLRHLIERAGEFGGFVYRDATTVQNLVIEDGFVVGVQGTDREAGEAFELRARVVVGADGRYSTVRDALGIDAGLLDSTTEVVWFKLPVEAGSQHALARVNHGGALGYFGLGKDESQLGLFVEKDGYAALRSEGIDAFYDRIIGIDPSLDGVLQEHVTDYGDTTLLNIEPGLVDRWVDDGVLLLGDAAHVASPIGGQGNGLAITDAVAAHPVICDALAGSDGTLQRAELQSYEQARRPTVEEVLGFQRRAERALSAFVRHHGRVPEWMMKPMLRGFVTLVASSPLGNRTGKRFAWGSVESVAQSQFVE